VALQVDVELTVREVLREQVAHVHRQRRLADPAHTGDRDQPGRGPVPHDGRDQLGLAAPAGEVLDVGGQLPGRGAAVARFALAGSGADELVAFSSDQAQRADQQIHRDGLGETAVAAFQRADCLLAELCFLRQCLLGQFSPDPMAAQKLPERAIHPDSRYLNCERM
jgi:hypothetical protein